MAPAGQHEVAGRQTDSLHYVLQDVDDDHRARRNENDEQEQADHEQDLDYVAPEDHGQDRDHDYDCLDMSRSGSAALKCEHRFTSSLPRARLDAALVVQRPSDADRDERL
jgi:hypothetical protein